MMRTTGGVFRPGEDKKGRGQTVGSHWPEKINVEDSIFLPVPVFQEK